MVDHVGQLFGNYKIKRLLSKRGASADVYEGEHINDHTQVAVKVWKVKMDVKLFVNDVLAIVLPHPHIVKILDYGIEGDIPYIIMAFAPYGSLQNQRRPLPPGTIINYTRDIADALYFAHQHGIVHRDVKPDNILLGLNHEVWVADFGIATPSHTRQETPKTQEIIGTFAYMAPEHWEGHASSASDQYSLGIMVYEWLCGSCPFAGNEAALYQQHKSVPPPPLHEKLPTISPAVERIVLKALAKKPQDRFDNIMTFATALERAALQKTAISQPTTQPVISQPLTVPVTLRLPVDNQPNILSQTPADPIKQLFQDGVKARSNGNVVEEFRIWRQIMMTPNVPEEYSTPAHNCIQEMRKQMIPILLKQARVASMQGYWHVEIRLWKDLLALAPSNQDLARLLEGRPLTLGTYSNSLQSIQKRLQIAQQNAQYVSMYEGVQKFIHKKDKITALQILWKNAPYYGDPKGLAQTIGLPAAMNYEEVIADEQARIEIQKQQERMRQEQERIQERNNRILTMIIGTGILLGIVGEGVRVGAVVIVIGAVQLTLTGSMIVGVIAGMFAVLAGTIKNEDTVLIIGAWVVVLVAGLGGGIVAGIGRVDGLGGRIAYGIIDGGGCAIAAAVVYWATVAVYGLAYGIAKVVEAVVALIGKSSKNYDSLLDPVLKWLKRWV